MDKPSTLPAPKGECEHKEIDWSSVRPADGAPGIVDVWCKCGQSGSVRIDPDDIQWEDD